MTHNKLVRDEIPKIIEDTGKIAKYRLLSCEEYGIELEKKLDEEVAEFHHDRSVEELADILEVVYALAATIGCSHQELHSVYQKKRESRGGFEKGVYLISVE